MTNYTPNRNQIEEAKQIYDTIIFKMVLDPIQIKLAHRLLFGFDAFTQQQARQKVAAYFTYTYPNDLKNISQTNTAISESKDLIEMDTEMQPEEKIAQDGLKQPLNEIPNMDGVKDKTEKLKKVVNQLDELFEIDKEITEIKKEKTVNPPKKNNGKSNTKTNGRKK